MQHKIKKGLYQQSDMLEGIAFSLNAEGVFSKPRMVDLPVFLYLDQRMKVAYSVTRED
ncbi:hypothetical protein [Paenibacillus sp. 2TAB26]|uniref:hypothetical protein n=1 Tax=Paenibacillus sp. 2TAB26 TaxID=3233005 RepID=UPI003F9D7C72